MQRRRNVEGKKKEKAGWQLPAVPVITMDEDTMFLLCWGVMSLLGPATRALPPELSAALLQVISSVNLVCY